MPDELYWRLTPRETGALLDALAKRERRRETNAARRSAMIAAEVRNTLRTKPSDKVWTIRDFVADDEDEGPGPEQRRGPLLPPEQLKRHMDVFVRSHNRKVAVA